ncbi:MAG: hypothetical protein IJK56_06035 [Firmicutes bacterium]|nr:hypothetical protein [Bacillota bacterium]
MTQRMGSRAESQMESRIRLPLILFLLLVFGLAATQAQLPAQAESLQDEMAAELGVPEGQIHWVTDADTIGAFHFSSRGMNGDVTFENEIAVTGTAAAGTVLYMGVFIEERGTVSLWESRVTEIPQAGFVQEKLALPRVGGNYYMIVVEQPDGLYGCLYRIERMSALTEEKLIGLRINLYEACAP